MRADISIMQSNSLGPYRTSPVSTCTKASIRENPSNPRVSAISSMPCLHFSKASLLKSHNCSHQLIYTFLSLFSRHNQTDQNRTKPINVLIWFYFFYTPKPKRNSLFDDLSTNNTFQYKTNSKTNKIWVSK